MATYQCPKCFNTLLRSNKILHDLKCTKESPVELSQENPYTSGSYLYGNNNFNSSLRYSTNDPSSLRISSNFNLESEMRNTAGPSYYKRMSFTNDDGTTTEIKKDTNMSGKEELLEITYDPQGNIIGKKKADGGNSNVKFTFHELQEYNAYDPMDNYNIYEGGNVFVQTIPTEFNLPTSQSYTMEYQTPNNNYFEHDFGSRGYSLMENNIDNVKLVNLDDNATSNTNYINNDNNEDFNKYYIDSQSNTYSYQNYQNNTNSINYTYSNDTNYNFESNNYIPNNQNNSINNFGNNYSTNYQNNKRLNDILKNCAKVTKLSGGKF